MSFKGTIDFIWGTWEAGGVVMFPLMLVAFLIYSVAASLLVCLMQRSFRHLDDETLTKWVDVPEESEGEAGRIIRYTQEEVVRLSDVYSRFSEIFASSLPFFERRLVFLNTLIATAPLLGLLGTVMGMLMTFKGLSVGGGKLVDVVASGISEALITTEMGLLIAVPGYFMAHAIKRRKDEYEAFLVRLESLTLQQFKRKGVV
ncbi:MAG: MotA/TolQ/ExbB proton channel family protein [Verrucomicrobiota bacterium]|nr:MotA/TolQ/ExbB proton channel family protein [Verrucomicrobiota bacterium]